MSFGACIAQNASLTLTLSPNHPQIIGGSGLTAMVGLGSYLKQGSIGGVPVDLPASFIWLARGIGAVGTALGVPASAAPYVLGAAEGLSNAGAVLGSAGFGWLVGSAANCMSEGVNP